MRTIHHYLGGQIVPSTSGRTGDVYDPSTGLVQAKVDMATTEEVDQAVAIARDAFASWRHSSLAQRTQIMFAFREIYSARREELAAIVSSEQGKVFSDAVGEVLRGQLISLFRYFRWPALVLLSADLGHAYSGILRFARLRFFLPSHSWPIKYC